MFTKIRLGFLFSTHLVFSTLYTSNMLLGYNMMLTCQFASQGFIIITHGMEVHQGL